jgi:hypothetical protein
MPSDPSKSERNVMVQHPPLIKSRRRNSAPFQYTEKNEGGYELCGLPYLTKFLFPTKNSGSINTKGLTIC